MLQVVADGIEAGNRGACRIARGTIVGLQSRVGANIANTIFIA